MTDNTMPPMPMTSSKPDPDPTLLTTAALLREIDQLKNLVRGWVDSLQILTETQLKGSVATINTRLDGNDTALVAALKAQKEEAAKQTENFKEVLNESKKGTEKQIDSLNEKIDDLKERLSESTGRSTGTGNTIVVAVSAIAALSAVVTAIIVVMKFADGVVK